MGMHNRPDIRSSEIDLAVHFELRGRQARPCQHLPFEGYPDQVFRRQRAIVHAARRDEQAFGDAHADIAVRADHKSLVLQPQARRNDFLFERELLVAHCLTLDCVKSVSHWLSHRLGNELWTYGCCAMTASSSSSPKPGASDSLNSPFTSGSQPPTKALRHGTSNSLNASCTIKLGVLTS